jgi:DHA1 family tetracycline resistance protein-like MFS transporter
MPKPLIVLLFTIALDGIGIGLVLPIVPALFEQFDTANTPFAYGALLGVYALMQFLFAPILGALSDRFGRRRILALSLLGATLDYVVLAFAPNLLVLFIGRAIAGMTGANMAVALAYISDITAPADRTRRFGYVSAAFSLGFVLGPALGGLLGEYWIRLPMLAAAGLNGANLLLVLFLLPRLPIAPSELKSLLALNPFAGFEWARQFPALLPLIAVYLIISIVGEIGATVWVIHGQDRYLWSPSMVGASLAGLGLVHALVQALASGPVSERFGEGRAILFAISCDAAACLLLACAGQGWMAIALIPLFCIGGVGDPALMSVLSRQVDEQSQGRLQGLLAGATSLASIVGPPMFGALYALTREVHVGAIWLLGGTLYLACAPVFLVYRRRARGS